MTTHQKRTVLVVDDSILNLNNVELYSISKNKLLGVTVVYPGQVISIVLQDVIDFMASGKYKRMT